MKLTDLIMYNKDVKLDAADLEKYGHLYCWINNREGITVSVPTKLPRKIYLHRLLLTPPEGKVVDHINGNGLDNRRCNLRIVTIADNTKNRKLNTDNKTGQKGVTWHKQARRYCAGITVNKCKINLGTFTILEKAIAAYKDAEIKYFGEFARVTDKDSTQ